MVELFNSQQALANGNQPPTPTKRLGYTGIMTPTFRAVRLRKPSKLRPTFSNSGGTRSTNRRALHLSMLSPNRIAVLLLLSFVATARGVVDLTPTPSNLSFEIVVSYEPLDHTFQRSVLFVNAPGTRLIFELSARKNDFYKLYTAFRASVLTWQWLGPA
jgi:hypothetical protein